MSQSYGMLRWGSGPGADFFQREGVVFRANSQKRIAPVCSVSRMSSALV
jgi:hypothetical protein